MLQKTVEKTWDEDKSTLKYVREVYSAAYKEAKWRKGIARASASYLHQISDIHFRQVFLDFSRFSKC